MDTAPALPIAHHFHPCVLREYDIRGIINETLSTKDAWALGRAFATRISRDGGKSVCIGYDGRLSSLNLVGNLSVGLMEGGMDVLLIGLCPSPMLYFAVHTLNTDGGIMVTGSHNPPDHNGFKMMIGNKPFFGDDITELGEIASSGDFSQGMGICDKVRIKDSYLQALMQGYDGNRSLKIAWDAGNGAAGEVMTQLCDVLPGEHILINETIDGTFPNHHPDPTDPDTLVQLQHVVAEHGCDLGIAFDGDGDRIGVIDDEGHILWGDQLMAILGEDLLKDHPGATIIADVKASQVLFDHLESLGGKSLMWKTGHSLIKSKMAETSALLAGEMSGHLFFADKYFGFDDALYAAVRFIGVLSRLGEKLSTIRKAMPTVFNTPELRFDCPDDEKFQVVEEVRTRLISDKADINDVDGLRVNTVDGWWLLRASNTQAVLVGRCESTSNEGLTLLKGQLAYQLRLSGLQPPNTLETNLPA